MEDNMNKVIIITYDSYVKEALQYNLQALEYIIDNINWINDIEIIQLNDLPEKYKEAK